MKILCTTDFSDASINAIDWAFDLLKSQGNGEMEIIHCVNSLRRSDMFLSIDDILEETAIKDIKRLEKKYIDLYDNIAVKTSVFKSNPMDFICPYAKKRNVDLIVTGTTGLTNLKDMTIGSLTEYIAEHSEIPVLTIPPNSKYSNIKNAVVGIGHKELKSISVIQKITNFLNGHKPKVYLTQVLKKESHVASIDIRIEEYFEGLSFEYCTVQEDGSVTESINQFCENVNADLLCLIHEKKNWFQTLFKKSVTKEELFSIPAPLFIVSA